jgi:hypothetical protein
MHFSRSLVSYALEALPDILGFAIKGILMMDFRCWILNFRFRKANY